MPINAKWMNRSLAMLSLALRLGGVACSATSSVVRIAEPVGPAPSSLSVLTSGQLVVHTPFRTEPLDISTEERPSTTPPTRLPYTIFDIEGRKIQTVDNQRVGSEPAIVNLADGDYLVRANGLDNRVFDVKVRIERGKRTALFLDGSRWPSDFAPTDQVVRTSDGTVIGWRATAIGGGPPEK